MAERFERHKQPWTGDELSLLRALAGKGKGLKEIAKALKRRPRTAPRPTGSRLRRSVRSGSSPFSRQRKWGGGRRQRRLTEGRCHVRSNRETSGWRARYASR